MLDILIKLSKPRITFLVIVTAYLGYYLGLRYSGLLMIEFISLIKFFHLIVGVFFSSSCSAILTSV